MRRWLESVRSLLNIGRFASNSKSEDSRTSGNRQIGQSTAVTSTGESAGSLFPPGMPQILQACDFAGLKVQAEKGDAEAQLKLGMDYEKGWNVTVDRDQAAEWYQKAADQGSTEAFYLLGQIYGDKTWPLHDPKQSFQFTRRAAKAGDAKAQVALGFKFIEGQGVAINSDEGERWARRGVSALEALITKEPSNEARIRILAVAIYGTWFGDHFFHEGHLSPKEAAKAIYWYEKAAQHGTGAIALDAQSKLGFIHETETKNYAEAVKWYRMAVEAGSAPAQRTLGNLYFNGLGVAQSSTEALKWYLLAAQGGDPDAETLIGHIYEDGSGVAQDYAEAARWYRSASEQGEAYAQGHLAYLCLEGLGVPRDYVEAYKWANLAAAQGIDAACDGRELASRFMTPDQIAEAERRSSAFVACKESQASRSARADAFAGRDEIE